MTFEVHTTLDDIAVSGGEYARETLRGPGGDEHRAEPTSDAVNFGGPRWLSPSELVEIFGEETAELIRDALDSEGMHIAQQEAA